MRDSVAGLARVVPREWGGVVREGMGGERGGGGGGGLPAKRTVAPARGLRTLAMTEGMERGEWVRRTVMPSAERWWGSGFDIFLP